MSARTCRGDLIHCVAGYIEAAYDPATRKAIYDRLDERSREALATVERFDWYPVDGAVAILGAIAAHHRETDGEVAARLEGIGRLLAEMSMSEHRLLFRLLTPALFASKAQDLWSRKSRCGALSVPTCDPEERRLTARFTGGEDFAYIGWVLPGFIMATLEAIGCADVRASFELDPREPAPAEIVYEIAWG